MIIGGVKTSSIIHQSLQLEMGKWVGVIYRMPSSSHPLISLLCMFQTVTMVYFYKVTPQCSCCVINYSMPAIPGGKSTDNIIVGEL